MLNMVLNILDVQKFEEAKFKLLINNVPVSDLIQKSIQETLIEVID